MDGVLEEGARRAKLGAGELNGGTGRRGPARESPAHQAKELRLGREVSGELARLLNQNDMVQCAFKEIALDGCVEDALLGVKLKAQRSEGRSPPALVKAVQG